MSKIGFPPESAPMRGAGATSDRLNRACFCVTLDWEALCQALDREVGDPGFCATFIRARPHLFSNVSVFISDTETTEMLKIVRAIEAATRLPGYRDAVLSWAPAIARHDFGPLGVFMGYDFHLSPAGPKLIEVNSNAGGAFLNALLAKAQRVCCAEVDGAVERIKADDFDGSVLRMFQHEWLLQRGAGAPKRIAIVDDDPAEQYLYPEFLLAQHLFEKNGIAATIADGRQLRYEHGRLLAEDAPVDLVYNRLVDFALDRPEHRALRDAYRDGAVVVTPNPRVHALCADKRNLALVSDPALLRSWGLPEEMLGDLAGVPRTVIVSCENATELWQARRKLFFKPFGGHGSKAVYRGDKLTKRVWAEIVRGGYVAQDFAAPGERMIKLDGTAARRKTDVRLFTYDGEILLTAARLYEGQVTNFRTPGGGFAPVFALA
ncbi:MAG: hypothetical protein WBE08_10660 [Methyloceanibacter sp.]